MRKKGTKDVINCVGAWTKCPSKCGETGIQTYKITTQPLNGGKECPFSDLDTRGCVTKCK